VVELSGARALPRPVSHSENGVTFSVEQFVASADETLLLVKVTGLEKGQEVSPRTVFIEWPGGNGLRARADMSGPNYPPCAAEGCPEIREPDGFVIRKALDPLPTDVDRVTLVWLPQGKVPGTTVTDEWRFDLVLRPVTQVESAQWMVKSYAPENAVDSHHGIELRVTRVFEDEAETIVETQIEAPSDVGFPSLYGVVLASDLGGSYRAIWPNGMDLDENGAPLIITTPSEPGGTGNTIWPARQGFEPVDIGAERMTLQVASVQARYESNVEFPVNVGDSPKVGDVIRLDVRFSVDGFTIHLTEARIVEATIIDPIVETTRRLALEFQVDSPVQYDGRKLREIWFAPEFNQKHAEPYVDPRTGVMTERLGWDLELAQQTTMVRLDGVVLDLHGPWVVSWPVPQTSVEGGP
jgi:hypothetical protein